MREAGKIVELGIQGMHCASCASNVERLLKKIGLQDATVNLATNSATFTLHNDDLLPLVRKEVSKLGYAVEFPQSADHHTRKLSPLAAKFLFSLVWTAPLALHMVVSWHILHHPWVQLALCTPVFLLGLQHFGRSALSSLRNGYANMDVLIALSITAAFAYSLIGTLFELGSDYLFYETSATIVTIVLLGNLLEERSVKKTTSAIEELSRIQPERARRLMQQIGKESAVEVPSSVLEPGDRLLVNEGDKVAVDGEIYWGSASIDQSMITGESVPAEKTIGEKVVGGTVVVKGTIKMRATAVGDQTVLSNMIRLVKQAQLDKPQIQRIGDKVSAYFVPGAVLISLLTFVLWYFVLGIGFESSLLRTIAVLVIACPCAMGLATPTAVMVGIGQAAKHGILIKGGATLEQLSQVKTIIFDKTGTLTTGRFQISSLKTTRADESLVKSALHGLERHSSHPIAKSIVDWLKDTPAMEFAAVEEQRGSGIRGTTASGDTYEIRSPRGLSESGHGDHDLYLQRNEQVIAGVSLSDDIKPEAAATIAALKALKIRTVLLSGDRLAKCERVADGIGIEQTFGEQLPEAKLKIIEALEREHLTAFVGDGVNDAPSLARSSIGISLSNATHAAIQSSKLVLLEGRLNRLVEALHIARQTVRVIKQNLFWAFCYNAFAIPLAALGYLSPMVAAFSMAFSDVMVIGNSLRLRRKWSKAVTNLTPAP